MIQLEELSEAESPGPLREYDEYEPSTDCDSEYFPTPVKRQTTKKSRKSSVSTKLKRTAKASTIKACACKGNCATRRCKCKSETKRCSDSCLCSKSMCVNKYQVQTIIADSPKTASESTDANRETMSPGVTIPSGGSQNVGKLISVNTSLHKSPHTILPKNNSPRFLHPGKSVGLKQKSRRRSKHLSHNTKKLLNTSKSTGVLTPSKHFVAPMTGRPSLSMPKLNTGDTPTFLKIDENLRPEKSNKN